MKDEAQTNYRERLFTARAWNRRRDWFQRHRNCLPGNTPPATGSNGNPDQLKRKLLRAA